MKNKDGIIKKILLWIADKISKHYGNIYNLDLSSQSVVRAYGSYFMPVQFSVTENYKGMTELDVKFYEHYAYLDSCRFSNEDTEYVVAK